MGLARQAGYLMLDHSNSPGIPADLAAKWARRGTTVTVGSTKLEVPTYTCRHCNATVVINPDRTRPREVCRKCMAVVCDSCITECTPFAALIESVMSGRTVHIDSSTNLLLPR
jgi:hypothetical protein